MARLSKEQMKDHRSFEFKEEEVEVPGLGGSVLIRNPSVEQREELQKSAPAEDGEWTLANTAKLFSAIVIDPEVTPEEAEGFLGKWPGEALDHIMSKFNELMGPTEEEARDIPGSFPDQDGE